MATRNVPRYTKKIIPFKDWIEQPGSECPICGYGYIMAVETGIAILYVHRYNIICEVRKGL